MLPDYLYTMTFDKCSLSSLSICLKRIFFNFSKQSPHISKPSFTKSTDQNHQRSFPEIKVLLSSKLATCCYGVFCIERSNQTGNFQRESLLMGLCAWVQCPLLLEMCVCVFRQVWEASRPMIMCATPLKKMASYVWKKWKLGEGCGNFFNFWNQQTYFGSEYEALTNFFSALH